MMKSFEQRKNEIRRRSEERIAKRRRRIKGLTCAAVCLLCVVGMAAVRPQSGRENALAKDAAYGNTGTANAEANVTAGSGIETPEETPELYQYDLTAVENGGVGLEITQIDTEADTLTMELTNYSNQKITYSPWFDIEQQTENGWASCAAEDMSWECVLYILEPGDTATATYWMGSFDVSEAGTYRLVKDCNLYVEEDSTPFRVVTEFTVEETP